MSADLKRLKEVLGSGVLFNGLNAEMVGGVYSGSIFRDVVLSKQDLNADKLVVPFACYRPNSDMNTWGDAKFENFPTSRPQGGFSLLNLMDGSYNRQIYTCYSDPHIYTRFIIYQGSRKWTSWYKTTTEDDLTPILNRLTALENK